MIARQLELRKRLILTGDPSDADLIGGADVSSNDGRWMRGEVTPPLLHAAIVVWSRSLGKVIASATASLPTTFPYIPGFLAFRELPALLTAWEKLASKPEVILVDGQGIAHPRRFGIACHLGLELGLPTIGCGKTRLVGVFDEPGPGQGDWSPLLDLKTDANTDDDDDIGGDVEAVNNPKSKFQNPNFEIVGRVLRTRAGVAPLFVSPGHMCDIEGACKAVIASCGRYRLPEPIRAAHRLAGEARIQHSSSSRTAF